jgi:hypothetical protein
MMQPGQWRRMIRDAKPPPAAWWADDEQAEQIGSVSSSECNGEDNNPTPTDR